MFGVQVKCALAAKAHEDEYGCSGTGTIAISNIGSVGGGLVHSVIDYPEVAILGVGTIVREPVINETMKS